MRCLVTVDRADKLLHRLGWSTGDLSYRKPGGFTVWQVTCHRDGQCIVTRADRQLLAWNAALKQAGALQQYFA